MVLEERSRHALFVKLEAALGTDEATTLMEHLPPTGWADVATRRDLDHLAERFDARFDTFAATMRGEMQALKADLFAAMLQQNRTLFFSMAGLMITLAALAFGAARLG